MKKNFLIVILFILVSALYAEPYKENNPRLYRSILSDNNKILYDELYSIITNHEDSKDVEGQNILVKDLRLITECVNFDNPELFWWENAIRSYSDSNGIVTRIEIPYIISKDELEQKKEKFYSEFYLLTFFASLLENDVDKIKYVHDYFCNKVTYDDYAKRTGRYSGMLQTAYSAFVDKNTVCSGYSRAFQMCMNELGIPCSILTNNSHAWNIVKINDSWYEIDITADGENRDFIPRNFFVDRKTILKFPDHIAGSLSQRVLALCPCNDTDFSYVSCFGYTRTSEPYTFDELENFDGDFENRDASRIMTKPIVSVVVYDDADTVINLIKTAIENCDTSQKKKTVVVSFVVSDDVVRNKVTAWFSNAKNLRAIIDTKFGLSKLSYSYKYNGIVKYIEIEFTVRFEPVPAKK
ncbi:transglutaminase domain-containing protein [Treponema sp.]|uniref:transglutaminase domain-containing protein n=1 Tax=Treponema sp. TaxID=166 RepID=UPI00298EA386|nr:transglutaminase domain-containing protein [Treponema sp.]MCR5613091.1 hypothetical protein [Treponema sp.]